MSTGMDQKGLKGLMQMCKFCTIQAGSRFPMEKHAMDLVISKGEEGKK